jgi:hypothetical protein
MKRATCGLKRIGGEKNPEPVAALKIDILCRAVLLMDLLT